MKCILYNHENDAVRLKLPVHTFVRIFFKKIFKLKRTHALKRTYSPSRNHTLKAREKSEDQKKLIVRSLQNGCSK